ncbi:MAG: hypothetical protein U0L12_08865 [Ruminococcus sp.]|nr:hypothetical protein [Ruminococcus sp.]
MEYEPRAAIFLIFFIKSGFISIPTKAKTGNTTDTTVYNDWYKAVYMPVTAEEDEGGVA